MTPFDWSLGLQFALAVALGLLVGLERESTRLEHQTLMLGGIRTFPILSMLGFACGWLHAEGLTFILPAGLVSVGALVAVAYHAKVREGHPGATSEVAALLTFVVGAMTRLADIRLAMTLGVVTTILLSEKASLESYVDRLDKVEFLATLRFLLVTVIILPVLPNEGYTAYNVNPARVWKIVVMVSSVGFVGYFLTKRLGNRVGLWLSGILGGIVSSTAASVAAGRLAQGTPGRAAPALQAALLAGSVMYLRILVLIAAVNSAAFLVVLTPFLILAGTGVALALSVRSGAAPPTAPAPAEGRIQNPFEIRPALLFALLFVGLTVVTGVVRERLGGAAVYTLAGVVGAVDVDPFILSLAQGQSPDLALAVRAMLIAVMSNTLMKGVYFCSLARTVRRAGAWRYAVWVLAHLPLVAAA